MHAQRMRLGMILAVAVGLGAAASAQTDEQAVRRLADDYAAAWNKGDARALAALYDTNATHIHSTGVMQRDRAAFEKYSAEMFAGPWKGTRITVTVGTVRFVKPDVAVADGTWAIVGARGPDGKELPLKGLYGDTLVKKGGRWLLTAVTALEPAPGVTTSTSK